MASIVSREVESDSDAEYESSTELMPQAVGDVTTPLKDRDLLWYRGVLDCWTLDESFPMELDRRPEQPLLSIRYDIWSGAW